MITRASTRKAKEKQKRLRAALPAIASAKRTKRKDSVHSGFDVDVFLKDVEVDEALRGVTTLDKNGKSVSYTKQQIKIERRFRSDLNEHYGESYWFSALQKCQYSTHLFFKMSAERYKKLLHEV